MSRNEHEPTGVRTFSVERLCSATLDAWAGIGTSVSARAIAKLAGLPPTSIYHHFGDFDGLCLTAQDFAFKSAEAWCEQQVAQLPGCSLPLSNFPALMAHIIDGWCTDLRGSAFAWRECRLLAARNEIYRPAEQAWDRLWGEFWRTLCVRFGCEEAAELTACVADSESLYHLIRWKRPIDRCCLDESARAWGSWLSGHLAGGGDWRNYARALAAEEYPDQPYRNEISEKIAESSVQLLSEVGTAGLTHRAVAEKAGVSLGLVSYNFKTRVDLLRATFARYYQRRTPSGSGDGETFLDDSLLALRRRSDFSVEEITITAAREADYAPFGAQLRYGRGTRAGPALARVLERTRISDLDAAIYSSLLRGRLRRGAQMDDEAFLSTIRAEIVTIRSLLSESA